MKKGYIIAHDVGTSCDKAVLVDLLGKVAGSVREPYEVYYPAEGFAEQNPEDWWNAITKSTKKLLKETEISPSNILGVTFSTQMLGIVPVNGQKSLGNAIIWLDARAKAQADKLMRKFIDGKVFALLAGAPLTAKDGIPKLMWIKENEPEIYKKMKTFIDTSGYVIFKSTGKDVMELSCASGFGLDLKKNEWLKWVFKYAGFDVDKLPTLVPSTEQVGLLSDYSAFEMGLMPGTPVFAGSSDVATAATGAGCVADGDGHLYLGTSGWIAVTSDKSPTGRKGVVTIKSTDKTKSLIFAETETAGYCLQWIRDEFYKKESQDPTITNVYSLMDKLVEQVPPGSGNLIFTPWMYGERAPVSDSLVRSMFFNISASHKRENLLRAVYEGVGYNFRWMLEILENDYRLSLSTLRVLGGGAIGDVWVQIISDITGKTLETLPDPQERGAIGAAFCAMIGLGIYPNFASLKEIIKPCRVFKPNPKNKETYDFLYSNYKSLYKNLKYISHKINSKFMKGGLHGGN